VLGITDEQPLPAVVRAVEGQRFASGPEFEALLEALSAVLGITHSELPALDTFVDWTQVHEMGKTDLSFGGHGAEHHVLTRVPREVAVAEVNASRSELDTRLRHSAFAFAYPGGGWNMDILEMVRAAGYRLAFTIDPGFVDGNDDPLALRRINIHEDMTDTAPMFLARLTGLF
jgi:hypothetical protein